MTGPKLNEANRVAGSKSGSRASAKYHRSSASKVRVVLNLVRNQNVRAADEILQFTDREAARVVRVWRQHHDQHTEVPREQSREG